MSPEAERGVKVRRGYRDLLAERLRCWRTEKQLTLKAIASDLGLRGRVCTFIQVRVRGRGKESVLPG